jgi:hypothetical protein
LFFFRSRARRAGVAEELRRELASGPDPLLGASFEVVSIAVWRTPAADKSLASWELVADIPLPGA